MAQNRIVKRMIESEEIEVEVKVPLKASTPFFDKDKPYLIEKRKKTVLKYVFGIFKLAGDRQVCEAIVEGTYADAVKLTSSNRTESGNTFKGFKKLKSTEA